MMAERFDFGKKYVFNTILKNDRLKYYGYYITLAKENGYNVCTMSEFYKHPTEGKHFVLRHDVDHKTPATRRMFNLEKKLHVRSTYYFRKSTIDIKLMNDMIDAGFEVGFHYETLSDYAIENNLSRITEKDIEISRERLKQEIREFNKLIKRPIQSVVGHGSKKNLEIGKSNNVLFKDQEYRDFGILFEGYDDELYSKYVDTHIMDGSLRINSGFSYRQNPIDAITSADKNIIFLSHPNHWYKTFSQWVWNIAAFFMGKCTDEPAGEFKRILDI